MSRREPQQYLKIANYLKGEIANGNLKPGDFFPSEAELCEQFDTSRGPVRQAMATLRAQGAISSGRGRRSVVLGNFTAENFESTYSASARYNECGLKVSQKILVLGRVPAPEEAASALSIPEGESIVYLKRLRSLDDEIRMIQEHYFPLDVGRHIMGFDDTDPSLHRMLASAGVPVDNVNRVLRTIRANKEDAELLGVKEGEPLWYVRLYLHDHNGEPVEYGRYKYRAEGVQISLSTVRGTSSPLRLNILHEVV
ncbi:hypothetical protein CPHO_03430 [Corynebacterium phocae]|uniref:HTH gntR-type domain-containing protein n=1 Tax=Corynebacterium phocae TaxID=161895 RepID=A0A1L7D1Y6_9CORY|nr:GntR family transcriptional regulator [Corynebacterium phocae]APT92100.1 hypothetical protein CPHO_03430 [Corynebacterium phocae]KAA8726484.1 GntR family transcriptional regulator [Corynebacterium phocae]